MRYRTSFMQHTIYRGFLGRLPIVLILFLVLISLSQSISASPVIWNTFLGSGSDDLGYDITVDNSGNFYVTGYSTTSWGTPLNAYAGGWDAFVAKLTSNGTLQWPTFLGSGSNDRGYNITVDSYGNLYVIGSSYATWGSPIRGYAGGEDTFVAKLSSSGVLQWHTFLGSGSVDSGRSIAVDGNGNLYVSGNSSVTWGSPIRGHPGGSHDAFFAQLNSRGVLQWNTFLGAGGMTRAEALSWMAAGISMPPGIVIAPGAHRLGAMSGVGKSLSPY